MPDGKIEMNESSLISRKKFDGFGWVLKIAPAPTSRRWKEALYLPAPAAGWRQPPEGIRYEDNGSIAIRDGTMAPGEEFLGKMWSILPEDVAGRYKLVLFIDGKEVRTEKFSISD